MRRLLVATAALLAGCLLDGGNRTVTALELRARVVGLDLSRLDPATRMKLQRGEVWPGTPESQLFVARGEPRLWWNTRLGANACRVVVHHTADPARADLAVTVCGGVVHQASAINPPLPCWRLAEVGPRIAAAAQYFENRPLDVQWQIVIGLLHRGQAEQDVTIAFGDPYSRGFDEREDGRRADKLVFLDHGGNAYGLNVTLIGGKVAAWSMPAERRLTPEAEQRRLDAMEQRIKTRITELEELTRKQHAETVELFGKAMSNRQAMLTELLKPLAEAAGQAAYEGMVGEIGGSTVTSSTEESVTSSDISITRNGETTNIKADEASKKSSKTTTSRSNAASCQAACDASYESRKRECRQRFNDNACSGDSDCELATGKLYVECAHSNHLVQCTKKCRD